VGGPAANEAVVSGSSQRYGVLLLALCATFFFYGVAEPGDLQRAIGTMLVAATLLLALNAAEIRASAIRAAVVVVALVVATVIIASLSGSDSTAAAITAITSALMIVLAPPAVVLGVLRHLRATRTVTVTVVAGVLCLYVLLGLFFAFVYVAIENLGGGPFFVNGASAVPARAVYFSFVTLATVGYGDYTARTNFGHTLSITEALLGQIYLVTIVAAIVSRLVPRGPQTAA
jgi:hypothetical protein